MSFFSELRRRGVLQTLFGYVGIVWLIVQVMETTLPAFDLPPIYVRWVIIAAVVLAVPVLALSWIFEWSPSGLTTQTKLDATQPSTTPSRRADLVVIAILAIAVTFFAFDKLVLQPNAAANNTLAVVPFGFVPKDVERDYIGYGIAADILGKLAGNVGLRLVPRSVSFNIPSGETPLEFARTLGVTYLLEGAVRHRGEQLQVTIELLDTKAGLSVWGTSQSTTESQLYHLVREVIADVEEQLGVNRTAPQAQHTPDPEAYRKRLSAAYLASSWNEANATKAIALIEEVVQADPNYALAWSNLGAMMLNAANSGWVTRAASYRSTQTAVDRLLVLAPESPEGYRLAAALAMNYDAEMAAALKHIEEALARDPYDLAVLNEASLVLLQIGRLDEAIALDEYIVARSPFDSVSSRNLILKYTYADRLQDALDELARAAEITRDVAHAHYRAGEISLLMGDLDRAAEAFLTETDAAYRLKGRALIAYARGDTDAAEQALGELIEKFGSRWPSEVAHVYAYSGQTAAAMQWLDKEIKVYGRGGWGEWQLQRLYDNLRSTPQWHDFLISLNAHESQLARHRFNFDPSRYR